MTLEPERVIERSTQELEWSEPAATATTAYSAETSPCELCDLIVCRYVYN